ncbi:MAG: hypothetical protein DRG24_02665 [Epsilonproteobacteria bacterium]|nr:MAG: hypothetical protein DRG24_02665 [Campylobacterota bacterium]
MNISFNRIGKLIQDFEIDSGDASMKGTLELSRRDSVMMNAHLSGKLELPCDVCAEPFDIMLDEDVRILLYNGIYNGSDSEYDIVEVEDSMINMDELMHSEIELIKSDYHRCETCKTKEERN